MAEEDSLVAAEDSLVAAEDSLVAESHPTPAPGMGVPG
jgi:hypothetical protein